MPFGDGTGPRGLGPRTGRGLGPCEAGLARERRYGRGFGRGYGWWAYNPVTREEEKRILEAEKKSIEQRLKEIEE